METSLINASMFSSRPSRKRTTTSDPMPLLKLCAQAILKHDPTFPEKNPDELCIPRELASYVCSQETVALRIRRSPMKVVTNLSDGFTRNVMFTKCDVVLWVTSINRVFMEVPYPIVIRRGKIRFREYDIRMTIAKSRRLQQINFTTACDSRIWTVDFDREYYESVFLLLESHYPGRRYQTKVPLRRTAIRALDAIDIFQLTPADVLPIIEDIFNEARVQNKNTKEYDNYRGGLSAIKTYGPIPAPRFDIQCLTKDILVSDVLCVWFFLLPGWSCSDTHTHTNT